MNVESGQANKCINQTSEPQRGNGKERWAGEEIMSGQEKIFSFLASIGSSRIILITIKLKGYKEYAAQHNFTVTSSCISTSFPQRSIFQR